MSPLQTLLLVAVLAVFYRSARQYMAGCVCTLEGRLDGRLALVFAADTDIGASTVRGLARRGAHVVMACQVVERCRAARRELLEQFGHNEARGFGGISTSPLAESKLREDTLKSVSFIDPKQIQVRGLHHSSAKEIKNFCENFIQEFKRLDILIVNAVHLSVKLDRTVEGYERNLGMNYLSSFLIAQHLLPLMERSAVADYLPRLVFVTSRLHHLGQLPVDMDVEGRGSVEYTWWRAFASSQLALLTYANHLSSQINPTKMRVVSVHPGFENRHFKSIFYQPFAYLMTWFGKTPWQATQSILAATLMPSEESGTTYLEDCASASPHISSLDADSARHLVQMSKAALERYLPQVSQSPIS